ncbi:hypothetical protein [Candidatus Phyllobacterium onerii]|nr:hypothetical protein [Phyllobacterium sp. IY22]
MNRRSVENSLGKASRWPIARAVVKAWQSLRAGFRVARNLAAQP